MGSLNSPEEVVLVDSDEEGGKASPNLVTLSSDSEDSDVLIESTDIEVIAQYDKRSYLGTKRKNRRRISDAIVEHQPSGDRPLESNSRDNGLKTELITPSKFKSSPNDKPEVLSKFSEMGQRLGSIDFDGPEAIPVDPESLDERSINGSFNEMPSEANSEQIEGVIDEESQSQSLPQTPAKDPIPSLSQLTLESMQCSQTISETSDIADVISQSKGNDMNINDTNIEMTTTDNNQVAEEPIDEPWICSHGCGQVFNQPLLLYKHERKHRIENIEKQIPTFKCVRPNCPFLGLTQSELMYHNGEHQNIFVCRLPVCQFQARDAHTLNKHMREHGKSKTKKGRRV